MDFSHGQVFFAPGWPYFFWGSLASYLASFSVALAFFASWRSAYRYPRLARLLHGASVVAFPLLAVQALQAALLPVYHLPATAQYFLCSGGSAWVWPSLLLGTGLSAWLGCTLGRRLSRAPSHPDAGA